MAISFVGSAAGLVGGSNLTVNFSDLLNDAGSTPTVLENDIVIVTLGRRATSNTGVTVVTTGYNNVYSNIYVNASADDLNFKSYYKIMGASPDTSVTITTSGVSNTQAYDIHVFRGVDTVDPLDSIAAVTSNATGIASPNAPSITPSTTGSWIVVAGGAAGATPTSITTLTNPSGLSTTTNHFRTGENVRAAVAVGLKTDWVSGAFDPAAFGGGSNAAGGSVAAAAFVLKPAAGGGPAPATGNFFLLF